VLLGGCDHSVVRSVEFPPMPDEPVQRQWVGAHGKDALSEAFIFYKQVKSYARSMKIRLNSRTKVLDFGVGWGRLYRCFLLDFATKNFLGIDVDQGCIDLCQRSIPYGRFQKCDYIPPVPQAANRSYDVVYAYSVFSHLSEATSLRWVHEFARILKPGGMLIATTLVRAHIAVWQSLMEPGEEQWREQWQTALRDVGFSVARAEAEFDSGGFLYCGIGGGGVLSSDFYGEAIISPAYIRKAWPQDLDLIDYEDHGDGPQAVIVAQKRGLWKSLWSRR
jgi:SAM-dependent methyltransferase